MKSESTIRRELNRVKAVMVKQQDPTRRAEQYGAMQALTWALGEPNTAAPHKLAE